MSSKKENIRLSVLIPVWNQEELVIKALDHLPRRDDMEVIVRNDGSTDKTLENLKAYKKEHPELNLTIVSNKGNKGVAYTKNRMLESCHGEYVHFHDSDDYAITNVYNQIVTDCLDGKADIVCMDLEINDGSHLSVNEHSKRGYCAQIARFIRREFIGDIRFPEEVKAGDDWFFAEALLEKDPVSIYTNISGYHYNFPRWGSLFNLQSRGLIPPIDTK